MKKIIGYIKNNSKELVKKSAVLLSFILVFTSVDLITKDLVYKNLRNKPDMTIIPEFWDFHYQTNDDIGFSALRWVNRYFGIPKKIEKNKYENKVINKLDINYEKILINNYYKLDEKNKYYALEKDDIDENDKRIIQDILSTAGYKTGKWLFLVLLQGLGTLVVIIFYFGSKEWKHYIPLALITAGALGNVLDRIIRGFVVDYVMWNFWFFPDWKVFNIFKPWPIFNLADVFTVIGALSLFVIMFFFTKDEEQQLDSQK